MKEEILFLFRQVDVSSVLSRYLSSLKEFFSKKKTTFYFHRRMDIFETIQQFHHDWVGLDLITSPSKLESFLWLAAKEEVRGLKYEKY